MKYRYQYQYLLLYLILLGPVSCRNLKRTPRRYDAYIRC